MRKALHLDVCNATAVAGTTFLERPARFPRKGAFQIKTTYLHAGCMLVQRNPHPGVSGSGHTGTQINSFDAVIQTQESPFHKRLLVGRRSPFTRLAEHLTALRAWFTRLAAHLTTLRAWCERCLPGFGENPKCPVSALQGCEGLWSYDYGHA